MSLVVRASRAIVLVLRCEVYQWGRQSASKNTKKYEYKHKNKSISIYNKKTKTITKKVTVNDVTQAGQVREGSRKYVQVATSATDNPPVSDKEK